jgi:hypothetical protein
VHEAVKNWDLKGSAVGEVDHGGRREIQNKNYLQVRNRKNYTLSFSFLSFAFAVAVAANPSHNSLHIPVVVVFFCLLHVHISIQDDAGSKNSCDG